MKKQNTIQGNSEQRTVIRVVSLMAIGLSLMPSAFAQQESEKLLSGKTFTIKLIENSDKKKNNLQSDEICFRGDNMSSTFMMTETKFPAGFYNTKQDSIQTEIHPIPVILFASESTNSYGELLRWDGVVTGNAIQGTIVWMYKNGKTKKEYTFAGNLKTKK